MRHTLLPLTSTNGLDAVLAQSHDLPVVLFKHSEACGMSYQALEEVEAALGATDSLAAAHLVLVQRSRAVSNEIAARLGVRHASPQLLVLRDGQVRWQASHLSITASAIRDAVSRAHSMTT